ncbi:MAG: phosphoesterase [Chloroflexi bacterium]|nr:phosphoesterase [Chloroflexota bacterium]
MTQRLYYNDAQSRSFEATIIERLTVDDRPAVVLDRTLFYPEGGGQPSDQGRLNGVLVIDVQNRKSDHAVLHILAEALTDGDPARGEIDWLRRFDLMQHHSGQHILSQAFILAADADTIGFHMSPDSMTIDLDKANLSDKTIQEVEQMANQVIFDNLEITAPVIPKNDLEALGVRSRFSLENLATDGVRVVMIGDFDKVPCGGTHVARTGEIGMLKVLRSEKAKGGTRVEFRCGWRALSEFQSRHAALQAAAAEFSVAYSDVDQAIQRLKADLKQAQKDLKASRSALIAYQVAELREQAVPVKDLLIVRAAFDDLDSGDIRLMASQLSDDPKMVALLAVAGEKAHVICSAGADVEADMRVALKAALTALGSDRGGGKPDMAQGGRISADLAALEQALEQAQAALTGV